ncbi:MAG: hypothetical protein Q7S37_00905 [bacterium]|nr:hypothetical protein [bacterium]
MNKSLVRTILIFVAISSVFGSNFIEIKKAKATDTSSSAYLNTQAYNNLVSDDNFISTNAMSEAQIQDFLVSKGSFLKSYSEGGRSAARIIWDAAHGNTVDSRGSLMGIVVDESTGTINPMAILITLQKEQSLITSTSNPGSAILNKAMGYGCAEGTNCNSAYAGFAKQIDWGAWQLRYNFHRAETARTWATNYKIGQTTTVTNTTGYPHYPPATSTVTFTNRATASLYRYTPHAFNGNYNFWKYFYQWFIDAGWYIPPPGSGGTPAPVTMSTYASSLVIGTTCSMSVNPVPIGTTVYNVPCPGGGYQRITIIRHKQADINGDTKVNLLDLSIFAANWDKTKPSVQLANLNPDVDEKVDLLDLSILAANWNN